jgi:hypothetical protein
MRTSEGWVGVGRGAVVEMTVVVWREAWRRVFIVWGRAVRDAILIVGWRRVVVKKVSLLLLRKLGRVEDRKRRGKFTALGAIS